MRQAAMSGASPPRGVAGALYTPLEPGPGDAPRPSRSGSVLHGSDSTPIAPGLNVSMSSIAQSRGAAPCEVDPLGMTFGQEPNLKSLESSLLRVPGARLNVSGGNGPARPTRRGSISSAVGSGRAALPPPPPIRVGSDQMLASQTLTNLTTPVATEGRGHVQRSALRSAAPRQGDPKVVTFPSAPAGRDILSSERSAPDEDLLGGSRMIEVSSVEDAAPKRRGAFVIDTPNSEPEEESVSLLSGRRGGGGSVADTQSRVALTVTDDASVESSATDATLDDEVDGWPAWRNRIRRIVVSNPWFDRVWFFAIVINCIVLASEDPTDLKCESHRCKVTIALGHVFTCLFGVEMAMKIMGLGFRKRRGAYWRDGWNRLDLFIVVTGFGTLVAELVYSSGNALNGFRAFRILRPLRTVQAFPSCRTLIQSILSSIPHLMDVFVLYFFFVLTMSIVAVRLWKGLLSYQCARMVDPPFNISAAVPYEIEPDGRNCKVAIDYWESIVGGGYHCPWGYVCVDTGVNPEDDNLSFDHIGDTMLTVYSALTLEGWTDTLATTVDVQNKLVIFYWVFVILFGSFFLLNLTIVIITDAFETKQQERQAATFHAIDKSGTGELEKEDVRKLLNRAYGRDVTEEELDDAFCAMDVDGGGTVSLDEFIQYTATHAELSTRKRSSMKGFTKDLKRLFLKLPGASWVGGLWFKISRLLEPRQEVTPAQSWAHELVCNPQDLTRADMTLVNTIFRQAVLICIFLNTVVLATDHYTGTDTDGKKVGFDFDGFVNWANFGFTLVFVLEAAVKLYGLGVRKYFDSRLNTFDFWVLVVSVVDVFLVFGGVPWPVFRSLRVMRVLRLALAFKQLQKWIRIVQSSVKGATILTCLLGLMIFILALTGMQIFGGRFCFLDEDWDPNQWWVTYEMKQVGKNCGGLPRANYDDVGTAFLTSFQILSGEDWNVVMYVGMRAQGGWVAFYFVLYYALGNYLLLNLFIAVLISSRDLKQVNDVSIAADGSMIVKQQRTIENAPGSSLMARWRASRKEKAKVSSTEFTLGGVVAPYREREGACLLLSAEGMPKYVFFRIAESRVFELLVIVAICVSSTVLCLEDPMHPPDHPEKRQHESIHFFLVWVFTAELFIKSLGYGFVLHPSSYLRRDGWNVLDFVIVSVGLLGLAIPGGTRLWPMQFVRTLRPLRLINRSAGMKVVIRSLVASIRPLANVMVISLLTYLIFGIMGVQIFKGSFYRCTAEDFGDVEQAFPNISTKAACLGQCPWQYNNACRWEPFTSNFDSLPNAMVTLFEMSSLEGWVDVMHLGMDFVGPGMSPRLNHNKFWAIYFLAFIVFGSFFIINMFIGVLIDIYYQEKERLNQSGVTFLNDAQRAWVITYRKMINTVRSEESMSSLVRRKSLSFVVTNAFEMFIMAVIVLNVVVMAMERKTAPHETAYVRTLDIMSYVFAGTFCVEAVLKMLALGVKNYFKFTWNRFDFFIVVVSVLGLALQIVLSKLEAASVLRMLRLARLLRIEKAKGIKRILRTLVLSVVSLVNVAGVFLLLLFVYALLGVRLFAHIRFGNYIDSHYNFQAFDSALLLLVRMATGEAWQGISADCRVQPPRCDEHLDDCGRPLVAQVYFLSYTVVGMYVLLNLFIAVILDNFTESGQSESQGVTTEYIDLMQAAWDLRAKEVDGEKVMTEAQFIDFVREIGPPLGPPHNATTRRVHYFLVSLDLHVSDHYIRKEEAFLKLFKKNFGEELPPELEDRLNRDLCRSLALDRSPNGAKKRSLSQAMASMRVQAMIKSWLARRRVQAIRERRGNRLELNPSYVPQRVPAAAKEVRVVFPDGGMWVSDPNYRMQDTELPTVPSLKDLADLLRIYKRHWWALTPEQQAFYNEHYTQAFDAENRINSALQLQPITHDPPAAAAPPRFSL